VLLVFRSLRKYKNRKHSSTVSVKSADRYPVSAVESYTLNIVRIV
jgi:hypothetical protein